MTLKRRLGDTLQKGKDNVITPSAQAISKGANYAKDKITGKAFVHPFLVLFSLETEDKSRRKSAQKLTSKTYENLTSDSASWTLTKAKDSATAVNATLDEIQAKYYTISVILFLTVFFAAYNVTKSIQQWVNPDFELEELHAYLTSIDQTLMPKVPELIATVSALSAWSYLMPRLNI